MPTYNTKWFQNSMAGAPVLTGQAGALIAVLNACLVDGFNLLTLDSLVVAGNVATGTKAIPRLSTAPDHRDRRRHAGRLERPVARHVGDDQYLHLHDRRHFRPDGDRHDHRKNAGVWVGKSLHRDECRRLPIDLGASVRKPCGAGDGYRHDDGHLPGCRGLDGRQHAGQFNPHVLSPEVGDRRRHRAGLEHHRRRPNGLRGDFVHQRQARCALLGRFFVLPRGGWPCFHGARAGLGERIEPWAQRHARVFRVVVQSASIHTLSSARSYSQVLGANIASTNVDVSGPIYEPYADLLSPIFTTRFADAWRKQFKLSASYGYCNNTTIITYSANYGIQGPSPVDGGLHFVPVFQMEGEQNLNYRIRGKSRGLLHIMETRPLTADVQLLTGVEGIDDGLVMGFRTQNAAYAFTGSTFIYPETHIAIDLGNWD